MRMRLSLLMLLALSVGCRTAAKDASSSPLTVQASGAELSPATPVGQNPLLVKPVGYEEPIPQPDATAEVLPRSTLRPVTGSAMTLVDLEQMALSANPSVARAAALARAARGRWVQVGLPPNPTFGYEGQQIGSDGLAEQDGVFVSQEIVRGGKLRLNREVAAQEVDKAEHQLAVQQQRVLTDVRVAYYHVLIAQRQEGLADELRSIAGAGVTTAEALLKGKEVGRVDLVQSQLEYENASILVQNAENRLRAAWRSLASLVGDPELSPQPLEGNVEEERPHHEWQSSLQRLLTSSPEIAVAMAEIERAEWSVQRARAERVSDVSVQGLVNWRDNGIGGGSDGGITVGLPLPLWNRNQGGITQASQEAVAARRALRQLELSLQNRLAPVYERYESSLNQVDKYRTKILPAAQQTLELTRQTYQAGETSYLSLLTAQRTYSQTNLSYLEALRELRSAEAEIEGLLLSGSLENR